MKFSQPLIKGKFLKRYKRFFADVEINGEVVTAHTPNTGSMKSCLFEGSDCYVSFVDDPKRKLKYTLEMLKTPTAWVGVHTGHPNKIVKESFENKTIPHWRKFEFIKSEAKINDKTRIDLALWKKQPGLGEIKKWSVDLLNEFNFHFVEVKNVTLAENNIALFPDAVTTRGQKHLEELMQLVEHGHSCEIFFTVQRDDVDTFSPAKEIDPEYARLLKEAKKAGVRVSPYFVDLNNKEIKVNAEKNLKLKL